MIEHFSEVRVRYAETDQMKIAHHSNYIVWFELARVELMRACGFPYAKMEVDGYLMPLLETHVKYRKPAFFDEKLCIKAVVEEKPRAKIKYNYEVTNQTNEKICDGYTVHAFMDTKYRAIKPPKEFLKALQKYFN